LSAGGSLEKATSSSGSAASERTATETARLKGSEGDSGLATYNPFSKPPLRDEHLGRALGQFLAKQRW